MQNFKFNTLFRLSATTMAVIIALQLAAYKSASAFGRKQDTAPEATEAFLSQSVPLETGLSQPDIQDAKDTWIKMFADAKNTIEIGQFYLSNAAQSPLESVIVELEKAGLRGVKIRTIVDKSMLQNDPATYDRFRKIPNLELRILDLKSLTGGIIHAKYFVVDGEKLFIGSQNFDWKALNQIHETGVYVKEKSLATKLLEIFNIDWEICATGKAPAAIAPIVAPPSDIELVASPPQFNPGDVRSAIVALKELFASARKLIRFQVMDYSTSGKNGKFGDIDDAIRAAAARGVKVEIMISDWSTGKPNIDQIKELSQIPGVSVKIVSFPAFSGGCISFSRTMHTKMMVVDGQSLWVGTSNWSQGYFTATRGVEMIFRNHPLAGQGNNIFESLWVSRYASLIDLTKTYAPPVRTCPAPK